MSGQAIISILSTNLGRFGANSVRTFSLSCSIRRYASIFQKLHLEVRNYENVLFSTLVQIQQYNRIKHVSLTDRSYGRVGKSVFFIIILLPRIVRIKGSSLAHPASWVLEILKNVSRDFYGRYLQL